MKTTKLIYACLAGLLLLLSGCSKEYPEDLLNEDATSNQQELFDPLTNYTFKGELPEVTSHLKGATVTKTLKFKRVSGIFHPPDLSSTDPCQLYISGQGIASHLGNFTVVNTYCDDDNIYGNTTAANGDEIFSVMIGVDAPPPNTKELYYLVYDGTGRFDGAYGTITLRGELNKQPDGTGDWSLSGEGEITF